ncbi:hypothetical protein Emed_003851 [Eimeria media]
MAALLSRRRDAFRLVALLLSLHLIFNTYLGKCSAATAAEQEVKQEVNEGVQVSDHRASVPREEAFGEEAVRLTDSTAGQANKDVSLDKLEADEQEDLDLLKSYMAAADATDTERQTDARFLGLSQRIRRHLVVDFLGLMALLAGCYLIVTGLEGKAPKKASANSNVKAEG